MHVRMISHLSCYQPLIVSQTVEAYDIEIMIFSHKHASCGSASMRKCVTFVTQVFYLMTPSDFEFDFNASSQTDLREAEEGTTANKARHQAR